MWDLLAVNSTNALTLAVARTVLATIIVAVVIVGPAFFMAWSPCLDCDGVCGAAVILSTAHLQTVFFAVPLKTEHRAHAFSPALRPAELPPRPLFAAV